MRCRQRTPGRRASATPKPFAARGGALCLDFCNSGQGMRGSRQQEWIPTFADLVDWLEAAEALTESQALRLHTGGAEAPRAAQQLFERAIVFPEARARVLLARTEGRAPGERRPQANRRRIRAHGAVRPPFSNRRWLRLDPRLFRRRARRSAAAIRPATGCSWTKRRTADAAGARL